MDGSMIRHLRLLWKQRVHKTKRAVVRPSQASGLPGFALEPRIMLDAALVSTGVEVLNESDAVTLEQHHALGQEDITSEGNEGLSAALEYRATSHEVVLIDPSVPDYETLLIGIPENAQVHILSSFCDIERDR